MKLNTIKHLKLKKNTIKQLKLNTIWYLIFFIKFNKPF